MCFGKRLMSCDEEMALSSPHEPPSPPSRAPPSAASTHTSPVGPGPAPSLGWDVGVTGRLEGPRPLGMCPAPRTLHSALQTCSPWASIHCGERNSEQDRGPLLSPLPPSPAERDSPFRFSLDLLWGEVRKSPGSWKVPGSSHPAHPTPSLVSVGESTPRTGTRRVHPDSPVYRWPQCNTRNRTDPAFQKLPLPALQNKPLSHWTASQVSVPDSCPPALPCASAHTSGPLRSV